jgi:hypothetical protein
VAADVIAHLVHHRSYAGLVRGVRGAETRHPGT